MDLGSKFGGSTIVVTFLKEVSYTHQGCIYLTKYKFFITNQVFTVTWDYVVSEFKYYSKSYSKPLNGFKYIIFYHVIASVSNTIMSIFVTEWKTNNKYIVQSCKR